MRADGREETFVVVGGGLAGATAALTLRSSGFEGRVVIVGEEADPPYSRPPLSKQVVRGEMPRERTHLRPAKVWADREIELVLGRRVTELDPAAHRIRLADGEPLAYDKMLLATGGQPRLVPGTEDLPGVHTLRTLDDAMAIRDAMSSSGALTVVGAGFIGAELAASARAIGCEVTLLELAPLPLQRLLPPLLGELYARMHRERGVDVRTGTSVVRIVPDGSGLRVVCTDEQVLAENVVVAIGLEIDVSLAQEAGLDVGDGVVVDAHCRTSAPDIYAAGDIANHPNPLLGRRVRIEHWQHAQHQGAAAARNMLGLDEPFAEVPWVWSEQYDVNLQIAGIPHPTDEIVFRGDPASLNATAFLLREDALVAVVGLNRGAEVQAARTLISRRITPDRRRLADPDSELVA